MADYMSKLPAAGLLTSAAQGFVQGLQGLQAQEREDRRYKDEQDYRQQQLELQKERLQTQKENQGLLAQIQGKKLGYDIQDGELIEDPGFLGRQARESFAKDFSKTYRPSDPSGLLGFQVEEKPYGGADVKDLLNIQKTKLQIEDLQRKGKEYETYGPKLTEAQSKAASFGARAERSHELLNQIESEGNIDVSGYETQLRSELPKWLGGARSPEEQLLRAAKLGFVASVLRKESGAAVTPQEFESYSQIYFPQPGDSPQVLAEKRAQRELFIDGMKKSAGAAWTPPKGAPSIKSPQAANTPTSASPQPGTIEDGYRFKGGNPSDPSSWEKVE